MAERPTIEWKGHSGRTYKYWIHDIGFTFDPNQSGNYIFAKETEPRRWRPIYIGQTNDLSERFDDHHKMPCIRRNEATHIHAHKGSTSETARQAEEADLIDRWHPICNGQGA